MAPDIADAVSAQMRQLVADLAAVYCAPNPDAAFHLQLAQIARDNPGCEFEKTTRFLVESGRSLICDLASFRDAMH